MQAWFALSRQEVVTMPTMAVMTGIQASGKSTFCKSNLPGYVRINLDTLHTRHIDKLKVPETALFY